MSVWITTLFLIVELGVIVASLGSIALGYCPWLTEDLMNPVVCALFGGVGGCVYCLRGVYLNACARKTWDVAWLPWYAIRPVVSIVLGGVSYLFVKSGLLLLGADQDAGTSQLGVWAIAFIAGLNVDKFVAKIESVGQSVWGIEPSRQSKSDSETETKEK